MNRMVIAHGKSDEGHEDAHIFRSYDHLTTFNSNDSSIRNPGPADALQIGTRDLRVVYIISPSTGSLTIGRRNDCSGHFCGPYVF
jgi:hypothetical protein